MRRDSDAAADVRAKAERRSRRRHKGRFAPAAPARGSCKVPWVVGATVERVVRLHEQLELREVALGGDDGARLAKAAHQLRIVALEIGGTTDQPGGGPPAHDIEALPYGDRHPLKLLALIRPASVRRPPG